MCVDRNVTAVAPLQLDDARCRPKRPTCTTKWMPVSVEVSVLPAGSGYVKPSNHQSQAMRQNA